MKAPLSAAETKPAAEDLAPLPAPEPIPLPDTELEALWDEVNEAPLKGHATSKSEPFAPTNCFKQWRRRLVQAVTPMWAEHGTVATTAEDVALATGIPVKSAAYYLRRQGDLLTEILANHLVRLYEHVCDAADASPGARPVVRLETILLGYLTGAAREPHAHYLLHHALVGLSKAGRNHVRRRYRMVLDVMADPLRELAPAGEPDRRLLAIILAAVTSMGDALLWFDPAEAMPLPETVSRLTAMLLAGVDASGGIGPRPGCGGPTRTCARAWLATRVVAEAAS